MTCTHQHYKDGHYMTITAAHKAMKAGDICWTGIIITHCDKCGADIKYAQIVEVKTAAEYLGQKSP